MYEGEERVSRPAAPVGEPAEEACAKEACTGEALKPLPIANSIRNNPRRTLMWQLGCRQAALRLASFLSLHGRPTLVDSKEIEEERRTQPNKTLSGLDYTQIGQRLC